MVVSQAQPQQDAAHETIGVAAFFGLLFHGLGDGETIHTRSFNRETGKVDQRWFSSVDDAVAYVATLDDREWDVYFGVTSRTQGGAGREGVRRLYALWADVDFKHFSSDEAALAALGGFELPPSLVVSTGGGYHAYWLLAAPLEATEETEGRARGLMRRLSRQLGDLDAVDDLPRILRVPGTRNQ